MTICTYINTYGSGSAPRSQSMRRCHVAGKVCRPNGSVLNWNKPLPGTGNAVIGRDFTATGIYQYALFTFRDDKYLVTIPWLIRSVRHGRKGVQILVTSAITNNNVV